MTKTGNIYNISKLIRSGKSMYKIFCVFYEYIT